jgi:ABC-type cobalamin/Fe3+-siderophores transport system ATPase subunit
MNIENSSGYSFKNLNKINILLGKNGCGKSTALKSGEEYTSSRNPPWGEVKYLSPERSGTLNYEAGIEQNVSSSSGYLSKKRRMNQPAQFKQQTVAQFAELELLVLREIENERRGETRYTFETIINKINSILDNIKIKRTGRIFKIYSKEPDETEISPSEISSGESELICLAIECLAFDKKAQRDKENILFLDEPDLHLHPDLQVRLMQFLINLVEENENIKIIMATHSTALFGAMSDYNYAHIYFMKKGDLNFEFIPISDVYRKLLPVFGAHPLSNVFNKVPVLLLEGEDDERIWQQVIRTSLGKIKVFPCACGSIQEINNYEQEVKKIIPSIYDEAKAYSLRDRDGVTGTIDNDPPIIKFRLSCRIAENLLLTDEVLTSLNIDFDSLKIGIVDWINTLPNHKHFMRMNEFKNSGYDRKNFDIKILRNDLLGIIGSNKPWEVAVGRVIGDLKWNASTNFSQQGSIFDYLGEKLVKNIIPMEP